MEPGDESKAEEVDDDLEENDEILPAIAPNRTDGVESPNRWDILCGRGKSTAHPGNQRFRQIILSRREEYQQAVRRDDKTRITFEIVESLRQGPEPSRFLLKDSETNLWYDVGDHYAREKISHALRSRPNQERRRQAKRRQKRSRKPQITEDQEQIVQRIIDDQQQLLRQMIEREIFPAASAMKPFS